MHRRQIPEKTGLDPGWSCLLGSHPGQVCSDLGRVDVEQAAQQGDFVAREIWQETCEILAIACINIQHAVNPECVVLAG